ncbi:urea carboxylase-associated family protein [Oceanibaculum nanhaiense]|uniref:urea carboxylase-associated family protein n=1 Tax=Oceanibaculum nanhaiense TaxID=1909734 RepID=UPI003F6F78DA
MTSPTHQTPARQTPAHQPPADAARRRAAAVTVCYPVDRLPPYNRAFYEDARQGMVLVGEIVVPPREARTFTVPAGHLFRVVSIEGPQVGDLNLWNAHDLSERFFSGKTRQLHATHVTTGDRLWSNMPFLRPLATITSDTLDWYGWDADGGGVHDVIGTRCDPYTNRLLTGGEYHHCCHSNLTRALAAERGLSLEEAEAHVHDVLNVFMCTGFTRDTHQYFMKASPVRPGDYLEMFAEIDLLGALSACPGGDCGSQHSSDSAACYPLKVEIFAPRSGALEGWTPPAPNAYSRSHGVG